jgi:hypothetical protein
MVSDEISDIMNKISFYCPFNILSRANHLAAKKIYNSSYSMAKKYAENGGNEALKLRT